jgi:hypothetical protein
MIQPPLAGACPAMRRTIRPRNTRGTVVQVLDYYPYGSKRIPQTTGGFNEQKQYVGQY